MTNKQINDFPEQTVLASSNEFLLQETGGGTTKKTLWSTILAALGVEPTGTVKSYLGATAPSGYLLCQGQAVSRTTYSDLFTLISTTYGSGDGTTTFNVPDFRGAFLRGSGSHGSETMADGNPFAGSALGIAEDDQMQGHWHSSHATNGIVAAAGGNYFMDLLLGAVGIEITGRTQSPITDSTNGTPRTGDETKPFNYGVNFIVKT